MWIAAPNVCTPPPHKRRQSSVHPYHGQWRQPCQASILGSCIDLLQLLTLTCGDCPSSETSIGAVISSNQGRLEDRHGGLPPIARDGTVSRADFDRMEAL